MVKLTRQEVIHVADLARLTLTPAEISKFQKQLSEVVNYISRLQQVETQGVLPSSQTTGLENVLRPDEVKASEINLDRYFEVAQILKKE
jgi:aspartyl-tRNA(Asn)/glutamyl-tRNA(Gln) amidotransferase subunit C